MICTNCGAENPDGSKFCNLCLKPIGEPAAPGPCEDAPVVTPGMRSPVGDAVEVPPPAEEPGTLLSLLIATDMSKLALFGATAALSAACLVYIRIAAEMLARTFAVKSASFDSASGVVFSETFRVQGILLVTLAVLSAIAVAACLLGFQVRRGGAMLGGIMAGGVCVADGILSLLHLGSLYRIAEVLDSPLVTSLVCFAVSTSVLILVGAVSGFEGERLACEWRWEQWTFDKLTIIATLTMTALLALVGIAGVSTGASAKSAPGLEAAYKAMREGDDWQTDALYIRGDRENGTIGELVHAKDKGCRLHSADTWSSMTFAEDGQVRMPQYKNIRLTSIPSMTGVDLFDANKAAELKVHRGRPSTFKGEKATCYMAQGCSADYELLFRLIMRLPGSPLLSASMAGSFEAVVWTSPSSDRVMGIAFQLRELMSLTEPGSGGQLILSFSHLAKKKPKGALAPMARESGLEFATGTQVSSVSRRR